MYKETRKMEFKADFGIPVSPDALTCRDRKYSKENPTLPGSLSFDNLRLGRSSLFPHVPKTELLPKMPYKETKLTEID